MVHTLGLGWVLMLSETHNTHVSKPGLMIANTKLLLNNVYLDTHVVLILRPHLPVIHQSVSACHVVKSWKHRVLFMDGA